MNGLLIIDLDNLLAAFSLSSVIKEVNANLNWEEYFLCYDCNLLISLIRLSFYLLRVSLFGNFCCNNILYLKEKNLFLPTFLNIFNGSKKFMSSFYGYTPFKVSWVQKGFVFFNVAYLLYVQNSTTQMGVLIKIGHILVVMFWPYIFNFFAFVFITQNLELSAKRKKTRNYHFINQLWDHLLSKIKNLFCKCPSICVSQNVYACRFFFFSIISIKIRFSVSLSGGIFVIITICIWKKQQLFFSIYH